MKSGELLIHEGYVREIDVKKALEIQRVNRKGRNDSLIGEILCNLNTISPIDLFAVLYKYNLVLEIGNIFIRNKMIDELQLRNVISLQKTKPELIGSLLVKEGLIAPKDLYYALSIQGNVPFLELTHFRYLKKIKNVLSDIAGYEFVKETGIVPITYEKETLTFVISTPSDMNELFEYNKRNNRFRVNCVLTDREKHDELLRSFLDYDLTKDAETGLVKRKRALEGRISLQENRKKNKDACQPGKTDTSEKFSVSDPLKERAKIDMMYDAYMKIKKRVGRGATDGFENVLFREFISRNHNIIRKKYECTCVLYYFEPKGEKVIIRAMPCL